MTTYRPRRLRPTPPPRWALVSTGRISAEQAAEVRRRWATVARRLPTGAPIVIDGTVFTPVRLT